DIPENRFAFPGQHRHPFYGGSQLYLRLFAISDDAFLKEINTFAFSTRRDLALRSTRFTTSRAGIVKTWDNGLAWIENAYYQDLIDPQPLPLQELPRLEAEPPVPPRLDADRSRELAEVSGRTGTEFARVFDFHPFGFEKLRHSIEPELRYLFVPAISRPIFDRRLRPCTPADPPVARGNLCDAA